MMSVFFKEIVFCIYNVMILMSEMNSILIRELYWRGLSNE